MHKQLKTPASTDDPPNDDDDEEEDVPAPDTFGADGEMREDYFFPGWISFKLFGPFAPEQYKCILMMTKDCDFDPGEWASVGHAEARCVVSSERSNSRASSGVTVEGLARRISAAQAKTAAKEAANVATTYAFVDNGTIGNSIIAVTQRGGFIRDHMQMILQQQARYNVGSTEFNNLQTKWDELAKSFGTAQNNCKLLVI